MIVANVFEFSEILLYNLEQCDSISSIEHRFHRNFKSFKILQRKTPKIHKDSVANLTF